MPLAEALRATSEVGRPTVVLVTSLSHPASLDLRATLLDRPESSGLARTFQRLELFSLLTVRENIRVAADIRRGYSRDKDNPAEVVEQIIERVGLQAIEVQAVEMLLEGAARVAPGRSAARLNPARFCRRCSRIG